MTRPWPPNPSLSEAELREEAASPDWPHTVGTFSQDALRRALDLLDEERADHDVARARLVVAAAVAQRRATSRALRELLPRHLDPGSVEAAEGLIPALTPEQVSAIADAALHVAMMVRVQDGATIAPHLAEVLERPQGPDPTRAALAELFAAITERGAFELDVEETPFGDDVRLAENPRITAALLQARAVLREGRPRHVGDRIVLRGRSGTVEEVAADGRIRVRWDGALKPPEDG